MKVEALAKIITLAFVIGAFFDAPGQGSSSEVDMGGSESLLPSTAPDVNYSNMNENVLLLRSHPLDLQKATSEEIRSLQLFNEEQLQSLISYRSDYGPLLSLYELQVVPGIDLDLARKASRYFVIREPGTELPTTFSRQSLTKSNGYILIRDERTIEGQKGYQQDGPATGRYIGSPDKLYARMHLAQPGNFSIGFTLEKDSGEPVIWKPSRAWYGFDFLSYHAQLTKKGKLSNLIVGDFQAQFGQGLLLGCGFGFGKSSETITAMRKSTLGFVPYRSVNESGFFKGIAISMALTKKITFHGFISHLKRDANLEQDSTASSLISSFALSGYHRTDNEIAERKSIAQNDQGVILSYRCRTVDFGIVVLSTQFGLPLVRNATRYNQFYFQGPINSNVGIYFNGTAHNLAYFGEAAMTLHGGFGGLWGALASLTHRLDATLLIRYYERNLQSFYSTSISEASQSQNEYGIYWGLRYTFSRRVALSCYADIFIFPWLRYQAYAPGQGSEWLAKLDIKKSHAANLYLQARTERRPRNSTPVEGLYHNGMMVKTSLWIDGEVAPDRRVALKTRIQCSQVSFNGLSTNGMAVVQDLTVHFGRLTISGRYALFDSDYDNRLYIYERDAAMSFSFPAYDGKGIRRYVLVQLRISKTVVVWFRWAATRYADRSLIGSGPETIAGNTRNDTKLQVKISL